VSAYELAGRREINDEENPSANTVWQVSGATSYANARATLDAVLPTRFTFPSGKIAYLDAIAAIELRDDEFFEFAIAYRSQPTPQENQTEYEFDVSAPNEPLIQAISTTAYAPPGRRAPEFGGAIGVQTSGAVQGRQQLTPASTFSITKYWPFAAVTLAYQATIESIVGHVNSGQFAGRADGTVKFMGARGRRSGDKFPISYQFGFRSNSAPFRFDRINVPSIRGWELFDVLYALEADTDAKRLVSRPAAVYVHQIAPYSAFSVLGL
jgi:hypothetical protein